jgi:iron(III) transport system substrate-binding protein
MRRAITLIISAALGLTACGSGSDAVTEGPLVVYSGRSEELVAPLIEQFSEDTGIEVEVRYAGSNELAATLLAEGETTQADVFFAQDPASLGAVGEMMSVLPEDVLARVDTRFQDADGRWVGTSGRVRVLVRDMGSDIPPPQTIDDVVDPVWVGQLGIAPTNGSFLAFVAAMILERGEDGTREWLDALADNDPVDFEGNAPIVEATDSGELDGGLVNHYYLLRLRAEGSGQNAENYFIPAGDVGTLVMPAGAGIIAESDRAEAGLELVEFLLSESAQDFFATETFEYPLIEGVPAPEGAPPLDQVPAPDIDLSRLAEVIDLATELVAEAGLV